MSPSIAMHILQMKSLQSLKISLILKNCLCTDFLQLKQRIKFVLTPFQHTPYGTLADVILVLGASYLEYMTFVFPKFLKPFNLQPLFPVY